MAWLSGYSKRKKLTLDHTKADADLPWFPVPAPMGTAVGLTAADLSEIFNDIGDDYLKIAVTKADGTTQMYVEIECWSAADLKALPWFSKSDWTMLSAEDQEVYFYWDASAADNTAYVGTPGNRAEVWNAVGAYLYNDALTDSAGNKDGVIHEGNPTYSEGYHHKAVDLDGDDAVKVEANSVFNALTSASFAKWVYPTNFGSGTSSKAFVCCYNGSGSRFQLKFEQDMLRLYYNIGASDGVNSSSFAAVDTWYRVILTIENGTWYVYVDGDTSPIISFAVSKDLSDLGSDWEYYAGRDFGTGGQYFQGLIDSDFIIDGILSAAWIKADYHAQTDDLLTWGATEQAATHKVSGIVKQDGNPVERTVRVYDRASGLLLGETTSLTDGSFEIGFASQDEVYVVALDDTSDADDFNALIFDRIVPVTVD